MVTKTVTDKKWKDKFFKFYGKHLLDFEFSFLLIATFAYIACIWFLPSYFNILSYETTYSVVFATILLFIAHRFIISKIAERESYPLTVLRHDPKASRMFYYAIFLFAISLLALPVSLYTGVLNLFPAIIGISIILMVFATSLILATFFILILPPHISAHREARLCFKLVSEQLRKLAGADKDTRQKIAVEYIKWLEKGFRRYNKCLLKSYHEEIVDVDLYYWQVYTKALIGTSREINNVTNHVTQLFESLGKSMKEGNIQKFLVTLQHIKGKRGKKAESTNELSKLIRPLSFSERIKSIITSPYIMVIVTAITTASILMEIIQRFGSLIHF